jgi:NH3-dependent NAD+ synthetase
MSEIRTDILETKEVMRFDAAEWVNKQIDAIKKKFEINYVLSNVTVGISAGIPSGVTASLTFTLTPKLPGKPKSFA